MKALILQGSPRKQGNTRQFSAPFLDELQKGGAELTEIWLYDREIKPCIACRACQSKAGEFGCVLKDDMQAIFDEAMKADVLIVSTPIYAFFATAPVKAFLDRFIYGCGKYYGKKKLPPLTADKKCALLATCGYPPKTALPMLEDALKRICGHIGMNYLGSAAARDYGGDTVFMTEDKESTAREFARELLQKCSC